MEISQPTFLTAYTDGTLQLPCKPYQYKIMKVKWFHNDEEITIDTLKSDEGTLKDGSRKKISILPDGYLEISKIERLVSNLFSEKMFIFRNSNFCFLGINFETHQRSDAGVYRCEVSYGEGDATLREVRRTNVKVRSGITELSTPKFNPPPPRKISSLIGGSVMIPCHAGDRSPDTSVTEIRWEKDNKR